MFVTEPRLLGWELGAKLLIHYDKGIHDNLENLHHNKRVNSSARREFTNLLIPGLPKLILVSGFTNLAKF